MYLTKSEIASKQWPMEEVELPDFDGRKVRVKTLSAAEFLRLAELEKRHPNKGYSLWWITTVCDANGTPLFDESDVDLITTLPIGSVNRVVEAAKRVNRVADPKDADGPNA